MLSRREEFILRNRWLLIAVVLVAVSISLFYVGATIVLPKDQEIIRSVISSLAGATLTIALIDIFHEFFVARDVRRQFKILDDFRNNGVERVCTQGEINSYGRDQLTRSNSFKGIGLGFQWLLDDKADSLSHNYEQLKRILKRPGGASPVLILVPNPCAPQIRERYEKDEPNEEDYHYELGLSGLADTIRRWYGEQKRFSPKLTVRVYDRYPMASVNVYDEHVFVSAVLFKRRVKDGFTVVYRRGSRGAKVYEEHIDRIAAEGSIPLNEDYLRLLEEAYPRATHGLANRATGG